jgi:hypothetical protein
MTERGPDADATVKAAALRKVATAAANKAVLLDNKATCLMRAAECRKEAETASDADKPTWISTAEGFEADSRGPPSQHPGPVKRSRNRKYRKQDGMLRKQ